MGNSVVAETLIGVCAAMVGVVTFRRRMPRVVELAAWVVLIWVCALAITNTGNPQAHALTTATAWAVGQVAGMSIELLGQGILRWLYASRFAIADLVAILFGVDLLLLALVSTRRQANSWMPVTRLGEWMVLPRLSTDQPDRAAVSAVDGINQRFDSWSRVAAASAVTWSTLFFIRLRDVEVPSARRGLTNVALGAGVAWRRVAAGRAQTGEVRTSRMAPDSADAAPRDGGSRRRVAAELPQLEPRRAGKSRRARVLAGGAPKAGRGRHRVASEPAPAAIEVVDIKVPARRVGAGKSEAAGGLDDAGTTARKPRRRTASTPPGPDPGTQKNGSEKRHRQGRLAS